MAHPPRRTFRLSDYYEPRNFLDDAKIAIVAKLNALQADKVLRVWIVAERIYLDRPRTLWEDVCRRYVTWDEAKIIAEKGELPDWKN